MEVMGLMLGDFVDEYTVRVVDVFAMPQSGTGVSVEAVDPVFQTKMMDMLKQTGRYRFSRRKAFPEHKFKWGLELTKDNVGQKKSSDGITRIQVSVVGSPAST